MIIHTGTLNEQRAVILLTNRLRSKIGNFPKRNLNIPGSVFMENGMRLHEACQDLAKEGYRLTGLTLRFEHDVVKEKSKA